MKSKGTNSSHCKEGRRRIFEFYFLVTQCKSILVPKNLKSFQQFNEHFQQPFSGQKQWAIFTNKIKRFLQLCNCPHP